MTNRTAIMRELPKADLAECHFVITEGQISTAGEGELLANAPNALIRLLEGDNKGKRMVRLGPDKA